MHNERPDPYFARNNTLKILKDLWGEYYKAYQKNQGTKEITQAKQEWLTAGMTVWDGTPDQIDQTYTDSEHTTMLADAGNLPSSFTRENLLNSWVQQEAGLGHWGQGHPQTDYRVFEGGADEFGSLGFSQIKYSYRYGNADKCQHLANYNLFDPEDSIMTLTTFGASSCNGGFISAFGATGDWRKTLTKNNASDLVAYYHEGQTPIAIDADRVDDAYERLMKALATYNGGGHNDQSWAKMLTYDFGYKDGEHTTSKLTSNRIYPIKIMKRYGIPPRTYIWAGKRHDQTLPDGSDNPQAGQPVWCFAYGEKKWFEGSIFTEVKYAASPVDEDGDEKTPEGQVNCITGAPIS